MTLGRAMLSLSSQSVASRCRSTCLVLLPVHAPAGAPRNAHTSVRHTSQKSLCSTGRPSHTSFLSPTRPVITSPGSASSFKLAAVPFQAAQFPRGFATATARGRGPRRTSEVVMAAYESNAKFEECMDTFHKAYTNGASVDGVTFEILLHAASRDCSGNPQTLRGHVARVSEAAADCGVTRSPAFNVQAVKALITLGDREGAVEYGYLYATDQFLWKREVLAACEKSGDGRIALMVLQSLPRPKYGNEHQEAMERYEMYCTKAVWACTNPSTVRPGNLFALYHLMLLLRTSRTQKRALPWDDDVDAYLLLNRSMLDMAFGVARLAETLRVISWMTTEVHAVCTQLVRSQLVPTMQKAPEFEGRLAHGKLKMLFSELLWVIIKCGDHRTAMDFLEQVPKESVPVARLSLLLTIAVENRQLEEVKRVWALAVASQCRFGQRLVELSLDLATQVEDKELVKLIEKEKAAHAPYWREREALENAARAEKASEVQQ